jgi:hypothetical protein
MGNFLDPPKDGWISLTQGRILVLLVLSHPATGVFRSISLFVDGLHAIDPLTAD